MINKLSQDDFINPLKPFQDLVHEAVYLLLTGRSGILLDMLQDLVKQIVNRLLKYPMDMFNLGGNHINISRREHLINIGHKHLINDLSEFFNLPLSQEAYDQHQQLLELIQGVNLTVEKDKWSYCARYQLMKADCKRQSNFGVIKARKKVILKHEFA
uniref:Uncharacterized protein n=1 Tax=Leersia perrieri TaxID=77586 RepID=A0A0D9XV51_9ORYZ